MVFTTSYQRVVLQKHMRKRFALISVALARVAAGDCPLNEFPARERISGLRHGLKISRWQFCGITWPLRLTGLVHFVGFRAWKTVRGFCPVVCTLQGYRAVVCVKVI